MYSNLKGPNKKIATIHAFLPQIKAGSQKSCNTVELNALLELSLDTYSNGTDNTDSIDALYSG